MRVVDKRFALVAKDGDVLFPYKKVQKSTGRYGFALSGPGYRDRQGESTYTEDIGQVVTKLVFDGWKARVTTSRGVRTEREGSLGIGKRAISDYWVSPELRYLVANAPLKPLEHLPAAKGDALS